MRLAEITDRIRGRAQGAQSTDESRWSGEYLVSVINSSRAEIIKDFYTGNGKKKNRRINPLCLQKLFITKQPKQQEGDCYERFPCKATINLDNKSDGIRYIGKSSGLCAFNRIRSRGQLSNFNKHQIMSTNSGLFVFALYDAAEEVIEIYGDNMLEEILVEGIWNDPRWIHTYNQDVDQYPLNEDYIPELERMVFQTITSIEAQTNPDKIADSTDAEPRIRPRMAQSNG